VSSILFLVVVARAFRRGDFLHNRHANPRRGLTGTRYDFGASWRVKPRSSDTTST
jgi:hypothetical protein